MSAAGSTIDRGAMATLTIEGIPPSLVVRLTRIAAAQGRCVSAEVVLALAQHVREEQPEKIYDREGPVDFLFGQRPRSAGPPGLNVPWGDPG